MAANDYAIIVGITRYPGLTNLEGSENDARNFHEYLTIHAADKVPAEQAHLIVSSQFPGTSAQSAKPMLEEIELVLRDLVDKTVEAPKFGRRLWMFMAGHGIASEVREAALLMANASRNVRYHLPGVPYADWFYGAAAFDEVILLMDCCRDNYPRTRMHPPPWDELLRTGESVRYCYGFATKWSRKSREIALPTPFFIAPDGANNGQTSPPLQVQGLFTNLLIRGLRGEASVNGGDITGETLKDFIHTELDKVSLDGKSQQAEFIGDEMKSIIFVKSPPPARTKVQILDAPAAQRLEIWWNDQKMVQSRDDGTDPWEVELERGLYSLKAVQSGKNHLFSVNGKEALNVQFPA